MEMLFSGSMLTAVIVANLACFSRLVPLMTQPRTCSPWLVSEGYLRMSALGEGLGGALTTSRYSYSQQSAEKYPMPCLKQWGWILFLPTSDVRVSSFICHFHFQ